MMMNHYHSNSVVVDALIYEIYFLHRNLLIYHRDEANACFDYFHDSLCLLNGPSLACRNDRDHLSNHRYCPYHHHLHSMDHHQQNSVLHKLHHLRYNEGISSFVYDDEENNNKFILKIEI